MAAKSFKDRLKGLKDQFKKTRKTAEADDGEFIPVPVGTYTMQLLQCKLQEIKGILTLIIKWGVLIAGDPADEGKICTEFLRLEPIEDRLIWIQRHLKRLGTDLAAVEDSIQDAESFITLYANLITADTVCRVKVVEKDNWTNMRLSTLVRNYDG